MNKNLPQVWPFPPSAWLVLDNGSTAWDSKLVAEVISWNLEISSLTAAVRNLHNGFHHSHELYSRCSVDLSCRGLSVFTLSAVTSKEGEEARALRRTHQHTGLILMHDFNLSERLKTNMMWKCLRYMISIHKDNRMREEMTDKCYMNRHNTQIKAHNLPKSLSKTRTW